ncbi:MAG: CHASE2 domain-containing protein, partial [Deltaproteobacteria bacterium]|nr:CHASE2 domain-containing protein [Deltaproteobacteria bacterium]
MKKPPFKKSDLLISIFVVGIFIFFSFSSFTIFESLEKIVYGIEMRLDLPQSMGKNKIAIVNIDHKSLKLLGPWPWPRHLIADMIAILKDNGAKIIGLDIIFEEKEQNQGLLEVINLHQTILNRDKASEKETWILNALKKIEKKLDNDKILIQTVKESGNVILPVIGNYGKYDTELVLAEDHFLQKISPKITVDIKDLVPVNELITPFPELLKNTRGLGHINLSPHELMKGQVHLLFINYRGHIIPSMPFRLALDYLNKRPEEAIIHGKGIRLAKSLIPAFKGEFLIKFKGGRRSFPYYSFVDILNVKKVPAVFEDKIVLIGYTAEGAPFINTPVDPQMPRVEFTANIIEDLVSERYLRRPGTTIYIESLLLILLGLFASFILPRLGSLNRIGMTAGLIFLLFLTGIISFTVLDIWLKTIYIGLALITIYVVISIRDILSRQRAFGLTSRESIETNRMLGLSFQSQGLLDLAFEKFRKCPLDDAMKDVIYNLGLDYERKRMINKALSIYEYITREDSNFRGLDDRIPKLKKLIGPISLGGYEKKKEEKIIMSDDLETKPTVGR